MIQKKQAPYNLPFFKKKKGTLTFLQVRLKPSCNYSKILLAFQYSEFISKIFSEAASIFKSFDVELKGDFSFPRQQGKLFAISIPFPVGGFMTIEFSMIFI